MSCRRKAKEIQCNDITEGSLFDLPKKKSNPSDVVLETQSAVSTQPNLQKEVELEGEETRKCSELTEEGLKEGLCPVGEYATCPKARRVQLPQLVYRKELKKLGGMAIKRNTITEEGK